MAHATQHCEVFVALEAEARVREVMDFQWSGMPASSRTLPLASIPGARERGFLFFPPFR
jgi:hypothetical protein